MNHRSSFPDIISSSDLTVDDLPLPGDRDAAFAFAMTFNGYEHYGSFEESAKRAKEASRASLADIRNELFFAARAARHCGDDDGFLRRYAELLPILRERIRDELEN